ncbi:hypothetical protein MFLAVUS_009070 [Mucor flavus]|uniref:Major facilitator superfamily (MFS) profile domain-containing protein n=1 Tax=Mucor flavus TaxID=439312 RepID=A0ABP9Z8W5_9FUNG
MTNELAITLDNSKNEKAFVDPEVLSLSSSGRSVTDTIGGSENIELPPVEDGPDGGFGWFVVLGAFLVQVTSFGTATSVMQDYYEQNVFKGAAVELSFVGTIALVCLNSVSPLVQICASRFGIRVVLITGTFLVGLGLEMAGFSTQIWHLYLTQGVLFGVGASCIYVAIMGVAPQWFTKRRGLALGMIASGSGIGGLIIPFIMTSINASLGPAWTYRILGFICLAFDMLACFCVRERNPPKTRQHKKLSQIINLSVCKNTNYLLFAFASNIGLFGYFIPYFFLPSYGTFLGFTAEQGSTLVAVSSACNFVGRILTGILADRIGKINTNLLFTFITALSCLLIWTFAFNYGSLMAFATVFGLTSGSFFALISPICASLLGMESFLSGLSLLLVSNVISVFGPNIASAIETNVNSTPFFSYKMFAGVSYALATIFLLILKLRLDRNFFAKV